MRDRVLPHFQIRHSLERCLECSGDFSMRAKGRTHQCDTSQEEKRVCVCVRGKGVRHMLKLGPSVSASQIATVNSISLFVTKCRNNQTFQTIRPPAQVSNSSAFQIYQSRSKSAVSWSGWLWIRNTGNEVGTHILDSKSVHHRTLVYTQERFTIASPPPKRRKPEKPG